MDKIIAELKGDDGGYYVTESATRKAADRLEKVRDFLKMVEDPDTAPDAKWVAARAREILA